MKQSEINKLTKEGHIQILINIQVQGNNSEAIDKITRQQIDEILSIGKEITAKISSPMLIEGHENWFSQYAEIELLVDDADKIFDIILDYMVTNIEILAPEEFKINSMTYQDRMNDLIIKIRESEKTILSLAAHRKMLETELSKLKLTKPKKKKRSKFKEQ